MEIALRDGKWEGTLGRVRKNGDRFTARVVITPRRDANGKSIGFLLISKDISDEIRLTEELQAFGHTPLEAVDGETGLDLIRREAPELILCDIHLPGMDGFGVARQLKSHPAYSAIPLVAVTALAMVGDRDRILSAGFDGYITKPIVPETFVGQVEAFLPSIAHPGTRPARDVDP